MPLREIGGLTRARRLRDTAPVVVEGGGGFLRRLGQVLDAPGGALRAGLLGRSAFGAFLDPRQRPSGRELLRHIGVRRPGGLAGFGAEVALDPLNLVGGIGVLNKPGRAAVRLSGRLRELDASRDLLRATRLTPANRAAELATQRSLRRSVVGGARELGAERGIQRLGGERIRDYAERVAAPQGFRAQADAGLRPLVQFDVPFTGIRLGELNAAPVVGAIGAAGRGIANAPVVRGLREAFVPSAGRVPEAQAAFRVASRLKQGERLEAGRRTRRLGEEFDVIAEREGLDRELFDSALRDARESLGVPERVAGVQERLRGHTRRRLDEILSPVREARASRLEAARGKLRALQERGQSLARALGERPVDTSAALHRFADRVSDLARQAPRGARFGEEKVFVSSLFDAYREKFPSTRLTEEAFKSRLLDAQRARLLDLSRADLVEAMDPNLVARSEIRDPSGLGEFHFVRPRSQAAFEGLPRTRRGLLSESERQKARIERAAERVVRISQSPAPEKVRREVTRALEAHRYRFERLERTRQTAERAVNAMPPDVRSMMREWQDELEELFEVQLAAGARASYAGTDGRFRALTKSYAERVLSPEAAQLMNDRDLWDRLHARMHRHSTKEGSQIRRVAGFREEFTTAVNDIMEELKPELGGAPWFEVDTAKTLPRRIASGEISTINAGLYDHLLRTFKRPRGRGDVPLEDVLKEAPLHKWEGLSLGGDKKNIAEILEAAGKGGQGVPRLIAEQLTGPLKRLEDPEALKELFAAYDGWIGLQRMFLTQPFPAFHVRNFTTNVFMGWLAGVRGQGYLDAAKIMQRYARGEREALHPFLRHGVVQGGEVEDIAKQLGGRVSLDAPAGLQTRGGKLLEAPVVGAPLRAGLRVGAFVENYSRLAHFLGMKARGLTDSEALESVNKFLFDYADTTQIERKFGKRLLTFWTWATRAPPLILQQYFENPRKMAHVSRALFQPTRETGPLPEFLQNRPAIPIGENRQGDAEFLTGVGLPLEEMQKFSFLGAENPISEAARTVGNQLTPPIKFAIERAGGRDLFLDQPISESDRAPTMARFLPRAVRDAIDFREEVTPWGARHFRANPYYLHAERNLNPLSRAVRTFDSLVDPRRDFSRSILPLVSGARIASYDPKLLEIDGRRQAIMKRLEALQAEGSAGVFTRFFPRGEEAERNPEVVALLGELRRLNDARQAVFAQRDAR